MLSMYCAASIQLGLVAIYYIRHRLRRISLTESELTGRYGLGPKPGGLLVTVSVSLLLQLYRAIRLALNLVKALYLVSKMLRYLLRYYLWRCAYKVQDCYDRVVQFYFICLRYLEYKMQIQAEPAQGAGLPTACALFGSAGTHTQVDCSSDIPPESNTILSPTSEYSSPPFPRKGDLDEVDRRELVMIELPLDDQLAAPSSMSTPVDEDQDDKSVVEVYSDYTRCSGVPTSEETSLPHLNLGELAGLYQDFKYSVTGAILPEIALLLNLVCDAPMAMNCQLPSSAFDPTFYCTLFSQEEDEIIRIVLDTGCSFAVTPYAEDFIDLREGDFGTVQTTNGKTEIRGFGRVMWTVISEDGTELDIIVPCHWVPESSQRLLSPQDYCSFHGLDQTKEQFAGNQSYFWMNFHEGKKRFQCPIDPRCNLPIALARVTKRHKPTRTCTHCPGCRGSGHLSVAEETNQNLTDAQKQLQLWHWRLGHVGYAHLQRLMKPRTRKKEDPSDTDEEELPCLLPKNPAVATCSPPKCAACELAKAKRRSADVDTTKRKRKNVLKRGTLKPGDRVSMDQYESSVRGRLLHTRGREKQGQRYGGGTIFVDHASGYVEVHHQVSLCASDTLRSKRAFEQNARQCGVDIEQYHADNGVFKAREFVEHLQKKGQPLTLSGVGAKHQNGIAERAQQTVVNKARSMMQHAYLHWPEQFSPSLWPMALDYACWLYNHTPYMDSGLAPIELFCGTKVACSQLQRARVWGCPTYVLHPSLQDGKKIPKWDARSKLGQFLGFSKQHSSTIGLIRNVRTQAITAQFHCVYDELFTTVVSSGVEPTTDEQGWIRLFRDSRESYLPDKDEFQEGDFKYPELADEWLDDDELAFRRRRNGTVEPKEEEDELDQVDEEPTLIQPELVVPPLPDAAPDPVSQADEDAGEPDGLRRSRRVAGLPPEHFGLVGNTLLSASSSPDRFCCRVTELDDVERYCMSLDWDAPYAAQYSSFAAIDDMYTDPYTNEIQWLHPFALKARAPSEDEPKYWELSRLSQEEQETWFDSMDRELDALFRKATFRMISRGEIPRNPDGSVPDVIKSSWVLKIKRRPDGSYTKHKSRLVLRGDLQTLDQEKEDEETFAPVVDWGTVRLMFVLTVAQNLCTTQIDFDNAFVQSELPEPIYMEVPPGYQSADGDKVFEVTKSLYGDCRAPRLWYLHLRSKLEGPRLNFKASEKDSCLFLRDGCAIMFWVDDAIIFSKEQSEIDDVLQGLRDEGLELTVQDDFAGYLGIELVRNVDGTITMLQTGLINRILNVLGLSESDRTKSTPAAEPLGAYKESRPRHEQWNYRSVIGMIQYLASNSRCDLAFANHQCARFSHDPREPHEKAVKHIGRYLLGTRDKGMIIRPSADLTLDAYADADFCGLWKVESADDPKSARSRTGFVITLGNIPVVWVSKLQTETALSTAEAELIALSTCMRSLIPLRITLREVCTSLNLSHASKSTISTLWEDNQATRILANSRPPRLTPRSRYISAKYWWFQEHLGDEIKIKAILTEEQKADLFTKPLRTAVFAKIRKLLLGW